MLSPQLLLAIKAIIVVYVDQMLDWSKALAWGGGEDGSTLHAACPATCLVDVHPGETPFPKRHQDASFLLEDPPYSKSHKGWHRLAAALGLLFLPALSILTAASCSPARLD